MEKEPRHEHREKLLAMAREARLKGVREEEMEKALPLDRDSLLLLSQKLEEEGEAMILSFFPLFLISRASFIFLAEKILVFLMHFHQMHPQEHGISPERVQKRFDVPRRTLRLALEYLVKKGDIRKEGGRLRHSGFERTLTPEEEELLSTLEEMCFRGKYFSVSLKEIQQQSRLSPKRIQQLLPHLIERRKIVEGKDGFYLHSEWLDEIIAKIKKSGKKELTVADFKKMTDLTRKYAIPLLELLDQLGVTRRVGPTREIL